MITNSIHPLIGLAEHYLKIEIKKAQPLTQCDLSQTFLITTANNTQYVIKNGFNPVIEADMLNTLYHHQIDTPQVIFANEQILILEFIQETNCLSKEAWQNLALNLSKLHQIHHTNYGWKSDYAFATAKIINTPSHNWVSFWGNNRLACYLDKLPLSTAKKIEHLINNLDHYIPANPTPSLLHGDLWMGNIVTHINKPYFIDPACYYGHNEVDIAMLSIFGNLPDIFYKKYNFLEKGWEERILIYQLFPALIHYILFGEYYLYMIDDLLNRLKL